MNEIIQNYAKNYIFGGAFDAMQHTPTRIHKNRVRASRTLSDDIKYIYDCVSRVIGPRIFLAILSRYLFLPLAPPCSLDFSLSLSPFFSLSFYFSLPLHPSLGLRRPQRERRRLVSLPSISLRTFSPIPFSLFRPTREERLSSLPLLVAACWSVHRSSCWRRNCPRHPLRLPSNSPTIRGTSCPSGRG